MNDKEEINKRDTLYGEADAQDNTTDLKYLIKHPGKKLEQRIS
jgi:hypothetical protein